MKDRIFGTDLEDEWGRIMDGRHVEAEKIRKEKEKRAMKLVRIKRGLLSPEVPDNISWLKFEEEAPRGMEGDKSRISFEKGLERMGASGYNRPPTPQEYLSLVMAYDEGWLSRHPLEKIVADIFWDNGEFTAHGYQRSTNQLIIYEFAHGMKYEFKEGTYITPDDTTWYSRALPFYAGEESGHISINKINEVSPGLINYLFNRDFEDIPKAMREGSDEMHIYIPNDDVIRPMIFRDWSMKYNIHGIYTHCASRGVWYETDMEVPF